MTKASLRTGLPNTTVQQLAAAGAPAPANAQPQPRTNPAPAPRPTAAPVSTVKPGVIHQRGGAPARVTTLTPTAPPAPPRVVAAPRPAPAPAPALVKAAPVTAPARPAPVTSPTAPATPAAPVRAPRARKTAAPAASQPVIDVVTEVVQTDTPVDGVTVESVNTAAVSVEDQLVGEAPAEIQDNGAVTETAPEVVQEPVVEVEQPVAQSVIVRPPSSIAVASGANPGAGLEGDWGSDDLKFPQLKCVQGSGPLAAQFDVGTVILADQFLLPAASVAEGAVNPLLYFVPLSIKKQWRENLTKEQQAEGEMPRVVNTIAEVEDLGGTTRWMSNQRPSWQPSARCLFLIECPEGCDHPNFVQELDGRLYAPAVYYAGGGAYNVSAKVIYNTALTSLMMPVLDGSGQPQLDAQGRIVKAPMLHKNFWTIQFKKKPSGDFIVWHPTVLLQAKEETGPELRAYVDQLMNSQNVSVAAEGAE